LGRPRDTVMRPSWMSRCTCERESAAICDAMN
jgi:hypothetical protein